MNMEHEQGPAHERIQLRTLIDTLPDLVWLKDPDGVYLSCNKRFEQFFGATEAEIRGKTDFDFVDRELAEFFRANDRAALAADSPRSNEEWVTFASDGHRELLHTTKAPMRDAEGKLLGVLGISRNITEIHELRDRFQVAFNASPVAISISELDGGTFLDINLQYANMLGWERKELIGKTAIEINLWPRPEARQAWVEKLKASHLLRDYQTTWHHRDGHPIHISLSGEIIELHERRYVVAFILDITERKHAEELARQQQEQLQFTARLVTMGEMASTLAHELNQPLAAIASYNAGCLNLLENPDCPVQYIKPALEKVAIQAQRAGRIIRRVHDFVKKSEPKRAPCRLADVIEDCLGFIEADARKRQVRIECNLPALPMIPADHLMLEQVLLNLIRNGMDAMSQTEEPHRLLNISVQPLENELKISVADQGCGIAAEISDKLFTAFFSTKPLESA